MTSLSVINPAEAYSRLLETLLRAPVFSLRSGEYHEILNACVEIQNPTQNVVKTYSDVQTGLNIQAYLAAQWAWYAKATQKPYLKLCWPGVWSRFSSVRSKTNSNYGQYVWSEGQFNHVLSTLQADPASRRAVILFKPSIFYSRWLSPRDRRNAQQRVVCWVQNGRGIFHVVTGDPSG